MGDEPISNAETAITFYALRLLQIYENIKRVLSNIHIYIVEASAYERTAEVDGINVLAYH